MEKKKQEGARTEYEKHHGAIHPLSELARTTTDTRTSESLRVQTIRGKKAMIVNKYF